MPLQEEPQTLLQTTSRVTAVFDSEAQAEQAVASLRQMGVSDNQLSIVAKHGSNATVSGAGSATHDDTGDRIGKGALAGAGAGALFGLAALAIPGVGPFITAGFLASALGVTGGAVAAGAIVGATSGALANAFTSAGYDEHEARYYGGAVEQGGTFVAVDTAGSNMTPDQVRSVLTQNGGRLYSAAA